MEGLILPKEYEAKLTLRETQRAIKIVKDNFQKKLAHELNLDRVTAPVLVRNDSGINDDLNGVERAVTFPIKDLKDARAEVVHSLAKWKRLTLAEYGIPQGYGI